MQDDSVKEKIALNYVLCKKRKRGIFMKNILDRQKDIISIISSLDISPIMYKNADEKYKAITKFLCDCGIEANIYPQGSFAFGTVVRPNAKDPDAGYDLDVICQIKGNRNSCAPSELRNQVKEALESSNVYGGKLEVYEECFTIEYADVSGISFTIDIVPSTDEDWETKNRLRIQSNNPDLLDTAIAIPRYNGERNYSWLTNNPKGFRTWFEKINEPFLLASRDMYRQEILENNLSLYNSVEEIPHELDRSALQRVIQILKYHRDIYYSHFDDGDDIKPISAILNYVVAKIAENYNPKSSVFELLEYVLNELSIYAEHQNLSNLEFANIYGNRNVFGKVDGKWKIANPANPEDNLANKWNDDKRIPEMFFMWVKTAKNDLIQGLQIDDEQEFRALLENSFGTTTVFNAIGKKYCGITPSRPIPTNLAAKPYRKV